MDLKEFVKQFVPPVVLRGAERLMGLHLTYEGTYDSFEEVLRTQQGNQIQQ